MKLYIGNKNYSSWSMRSGVLMREAGIAFDEVLLPLDDMVPGSPFKQAIGTVSPAARVPCLVDDDGLVVWDTLAIAEYLAERFPDKALWPRERAARARARCLCAEMHSGFGALRHAFPMNIEADLSEIGPRVLAEQPAVRADLDRLATMWRDALAASGGPFLFGAYSVADAYFAPVISRVRTYGLPLSGSAAAWAERLWSSAGVAAWVQDALVEHRFLPADEPYRTAPAGPSGAPTAPNRPA